MLFFKVLVLFLSGVDIFRCCCCCVVVVLLLYCCQ